LKTSGPTDFSTRLIGRLLRETMLIPFTVTPDSLQHHAVSVHRRVLKLWNKRGILFDGVNNHGNSIVDGEIDRLGSKEKVLWQKTLSQARKNGPKYKKLEDIDTSHFVRELKALMLAPPEEPYEVKESKINPVKKGIKVFIVPNISNKLEEGPIRFNFPEEICVAMLDDVDLNSPNTITFTDRHSIDQDVWEEVLKTTISQYKEVRIIDRYLLRNWKGYSNLLKRISKERPETKLEISLVSRPCGSDRRDDWDETNKITRDVRSDLSKLANIRSSFTLYIVPTRHFKHHSRDMLLGRGNNAYRIRSDRGFGFFQYENIRPENDESLMFEESVKEMRITEESFNTLRRQATKTIKV